jgi:cholesterol oxidase
VHDRLPHNAKNTLVKNYLYLAERNGAEVHPLTTVTRVRPRPAAATTSHAKFTKAKLVARGRHPTFTAEQVVFAAARSAPRSCCTG